MYSTMSVVDKARCANARSSMHSKQSEKHQRAMPPTQNLRRLMSHLVSSGRGLVGHLGLLSLLARGPDCDALGLRLGRGGGLSVVQDGLGQDFG
jgi:hypothetical protein